MDAHRLIDLARRPGPARIAFRILCFALAAYFLWRVFRANPGEVRDRLLSARWGWLAAAAAVLASMQIANAAILKTALEGRGLALGPGPSLRITLLANFHSLVLPFQAGWGTRAVMLNSALGLGFKDYAFMSLGLWIVLILATLCAGAMAWLWPWDPIRGAAALAAVLAAGAALRLARIPKGAILLLWYGVDALLGGLRYRFLFQACGTDAGLPECVFMGCFSILAPLVAPVPGAVGILESSIVIGSRMARLPADAGLAVALLNRVLVSVLFVALGAAAQLAAGRTRPEPREAGKAG